MIRPASVPVAVSRKRPGRLSLVLFAFALLCVVACAGAETPVLVSHDVSVAVLGGHGGGRLPFDPRAARISSATEQLTAIVGHPLTFQFDVALLPDWRDGFEEALTATLENAARDLDQLRRHRPAAFAYGVARFDRVVCTYSALVDDGRAYSRQRPELAVLDESGRSVVLTSKANRTLVPRGSIAGAIERGYQESLTRRFSDKEPDAVAAADRADYFAYVADDYHRQLDRDPATENAPSGPSGLLWIPRMTRLAVMVGSSDRALALAIRAWLFEKMREYASVYINDAPRVHAQAPGSPWRRAESAYVTWLNSVLPTLTDDEAATVMRSGFVPAYGGSFHREAFPGFDAFAFGLREVDAWKVASYPVKRGNEPPARAALFADVLCLRDLARVDRCAWLEWVAESDRDTQRLADALLARKDATVTTTVTAGMPARSRMDLLHRLEGDEATLGAGLRALLRAEGDPATIPDLRRLWRAHPQQRGAILYILTLLDPYGGPERPQRNVAWSDFRRDFEGGATRGDVARYFAQGPDVVPGARFLFAARAGRFSFVDLLIPRLAVWLADPLARSREAGGGLHGHLDEVIGQVCHDGDEAGMAALRAYFRERTAAHPGDTRNETMDAWPKGHCRK